MADEGDVRFPLLFYTDVFWSTVYYLLSRLVVFVFTCKNDVQGGRRGRRRSSSISISDLPDQNQPEPPPRKRSLSADGSNNGGSRGSSILCSDKNSLIATWCLCLLAGFGINRSVEKDLMVLSGALDSWGDDTFESPEDEGDTDSSSADESAKQWIKLILLGDSGISAKDRC